MAERQKRQQQIAPADAAAANGSERRSPLPGDRGDRGSKVTNSPQPARRPPAPQINGRAQPAGPAPLPGRPRRARPGQGPADQARLRPPASRPPPRPRQACSCSSFLLSTFLKKKIIFFCLLGFFCWVSSPNRKPDSPAPGRGGDPAAGLPDRRPSPSPWVWARELQKGLRKARPSWPAPHPCAARASCPSFSPPPLPPGGEGTLGRRALPPAQLTWS